MWLSNYRLSPFISLDFKNRHNKLFLIKINDIISKEYACGYPIIDFLPSSHSTFNTVKYIKFQSNNSPSYSFFLSPS